MMKSNFLNLPSSASGDARRHVPFKSIIHKPLSIIFVLVFVFSVMFSYVHPVAALADPVFQPVYDTQFYQLPQFVDPLNSTQQDIFYFILGSQVVEYAGLSDYQIENPYSDPSSVGEWFKKIGIDLYNDVLESFAIAGAPIISAGKWTYNLFANIAGAANFAGAFNNSSFNEFLSDVQTNGLDIELYPSMFSSLNQFLAFKQGLYNWQISSTELNPAGFAFSYNTMSMSNSIQLQYNEKLLELQLPHVRANYGGSYQYNDIFSHSFFQTYHNVFVNTTLNSIYLCDDYGNQAYADFYSNYLYYGSYNPGAYLSSVHLKTAAYASNNYSSVLDIYNAISNGNIRFVRDYYGYNEYYFAYADFITGLYVGDSWANKKPWTLNTDLNFSDNSNQSTLMPIIDTLLDIKGLISDLLDQNELKQPALNNLTDLNGDPLPASQLQPVSVAIELPDSGITINTGLFTPLTKDGGYINYLWYMTKPLVQYTSDFVKTLVFPDDTGEGFDATGPGMIVYGVICLGLIGGLVVKCLL